MELLKFTPGLVGGHCIGVDPYYLTYKAAEIGYASKVILSGRTINDGMGPMVAKEVVQHIINQDMSLKQAKVLILGFTFKENVSDIRNTRVIDIVEELQSFKVNVDVADPMADPEEVAHEYNGLPLAKDLASDYDAIIMAVNHNDYASMSEADLLKYAKPNAIFYDVKGIFRGKVNELSYRSL